MECEITKNMPISAFVVFIGSFIIFLYLLFDDISKTEDGQRSTEDTVWIYIFLLLLVGCIIISGMCIVKNNPRSPINKKINKFIPDFKSILPTFEGKRII